MLACFGAISRLSKCLFIILLVFGASSATSAVTNPTVHRKIYLLRGLTNVLSPGIDQLADDLRQRNMDVTIANHAFSNPSPTRRFRNARAGA